MMRARIARLKDKALATDNPTGWIELERIKARAWPALKDEPPCLRQAGLLARMLAEMPITVDPDDLIAGSIADAFTSGYDLYQGGAQRDLNRLAPPDVRAFWNQDPYECHLAHLLTEHEREVQEETVCIGKRVTGHMVPDFTRVLGEGLEGIIADAKAGQTAAADAAARMFHQGVITACEAAVGLAGRYRDEALKQAAVAHGPARRDLEQSARRCGQVPLHPAETFAEALQTIWFVYMVMTIEQTPNPYAFSIGRLDQCLYPFYARDRAAGRMSDDDALELLEAFWLKFVVGKSCWAVSQNILLSGVTRLGEDATNPVSYLALQATAELRTPQPSVAVRVHGNAPQEFMHQALEVMRLGLGIPALHNDASIVDMKVYQGVPAVDARDYAIAGCQEPVIQGRENARTTGGKFNLAKCLELALNDGVSTLTGRPLGPRTGLNFPDFTAVREAYHEQVRYFVRQMVETHNKADQLIARERPLPFLSAIIYDCLENARDVRTDGAMYNATGVLVHGLANVADSLMAIKRLVFDTKQVAMAALLTALKTNFAGAEPLRQLLLNGAPKYGNDEDEVDRLAGEEFEFMAAETARYRNTWGGRFRAGFNTPSTHVHYGRKTGATPDGRKAGQSLAYGTGPMEGRPQGGPTAIINSVTKFSHRSAANGTDLSLSFMPAVLSGECGIAVLLAAVWTLFQEGAHHVQVNVVDTETLRAAQADPEAYRDLVVRVHGFSTYFTSLAPEIQEDIIARTASEI